MRSSYGTSYAGGGTYTGGTYTGGTYTGGTYTGGSVTAGSFPPVGTGTYSGTATMGRTSSRPGSGASTPVPSGTGMTRSASQSSASGAVRASGMSVVGRRGLDFGPGTPVDTTGDGQADSTGWDTTGDGVLDAFDTTGDGYIDAVLNTSSGPTTTSASPPPAPPAPSPAPDPTRTSLASKSSAGVDQQLASQCASCDYIFPDHDDSKFCRMCGARRGGGYSAVTGAPPTRSTAPSYSTFTPHAGLASRKAASQINADRARMRVLIIGPGFGQQLNPQQLAVVQNAGFQVAVIQTVPNPEQPGFMMAQHIGTVKHAIDEFQPHLLVSASKGNGYMTECWQNGYWRGPSLMINVNPALRQLPKNIPIVLACGANDETYPVKRSAVEALVQTGSPNQVFLYFTQNSGRLPTGYTRQGDMHNMETLKQYECLPRLIDAAVCPDGPEVSFMRSWANFLSPARLEAEAYLTYNPDSWRQKFWTNRAAHDQPLIPLDPGSMEYRMVQTAFLANPVVPRAYTDINPAAWDRTRVMRIERVENELQLEGNARPYYSSLYRAIEDQGVRFEDGTHTRWAFHGSDALESIVTNPMSGFQPLVSGARSLALWGPGTYFARDAKYASDGGFCGKSREGYNQMMMCLLSIGIPACGDSENRGILPFRQKYNRFNSTVDSLSNPEIYVTQVPGAAYPAYVITFL
mmetsp:Transcript_27333/g.63731  ORF Transcript_27333/g.63731 Transcript_27333/m.63731 type:complete len:689 (+) Transcript_27333:116-2182(+)|eukprot:CAMPEP_0178415690 /NCGR_PEP_ID=MMETSP0689_2-20121128/23680_1 /TAXON_ID=160604 /ORGANISM="Amphidinium massartii, Strain CS-259" /LENGTH=688 /DNA_ID=CAMNT_0020037015 /DNA_START=20 /DNA_END=2086 /DNA_ORIENTATION=+